MTERGDIPTISLPVPAVITAASRLSIGASIGKTGSATPASGANPFASGDLLAFPFTLPAPTTIFKAFWVNGSSVSNNTAIAIYDADYNKLAQTSSTGNSGASVPQVATLSVKLPTGLFYCAMAHDSATTNRYFRWSIATTGAGFWKMMGCWRQASVTLATLPSPATPVACNNVAFPVFGLITRSVFDV